MSIIADHYDLTINGELCSVATGITLAGLLRGRGIDPEHTRGVAVALNEEVVRRQDWSDIRLHSGDRVEIVTAKQGG